MKHRGKFITIYGVNNLGKTTQARLLAGEIAEWVTQKTGITDGVKSVYRKYPIYELPPSGPMINRYLRSDRRDPLNPRSDNADRRNPFGLSPREAQIMYVLNRTQFDPHLRKE